MTLAQVFTFTRNNADKHPDVVTMNCQSVFKDLRGSDTRLAFLVDPVLFGIEEFNAILGMS